MPKDVSKEYNKQTKTYQMRRLFLLILVALTFSTCKTQEKPTLDINDLNYGWSSEYDTKTHAIDIQSAWGARGWIFGEENDSTTYADVSMYDRVVIDLTGIKGPVSKMNLIVKYAGTDFISRDLPTIVNGNTTIKVKLADEYKGKVKSIFLMCDTMCEMTVKNAYFDKLHQYGEAKELKMSELGMISSDQFEGYSDNALVQFTFETKGEMMGLNKYGQMVDMTGWGIGIICSVADILGAELPSRCIVLRGLGEQTYSCELGDIRYLTSLKDDDGDCGIYWTVWDTGGITEANVIRTTISEAID